MSDFLQGRLVAARAAIEAAGAGLMRLRAGVASMSSRDDGDQLKTGADAAAEGWVLGYLRDAYPEDRYLAEEEYERASRWDAPGEYWTVDALDGTRSFAGGWDGFCVQVAFMSDGVPVLGVVREPVAGTTYWAVSGAGAFAQADGTEPRRLALGAPCVPEQPVFADSTRPGGPVGQELHRLRGRWLECGSIGVKICRVAAGEADVFAKRLTFKLWDVAPGDAIVSEAGGRLGLWDGSPVPYDTGRVLFDDVLCARPGLFEEVAASLGGAAR